MSQITVPQMSIAETAPGPQRKLHGLGAWLGRGLPVITVRPAISPKVPSFVSLQRGVFWSGVHSNRRPFGQPEHWSALAIGMHLVIVRARRLCIAAGD